jgi:beta-xylosidase
LSSLFAPRLRLPEEKGSTGGYVYVDDVIDRVAALNLHPILELPARSPAVGALVRHILGRYNVVEVRQWQFEIEADEPARYGAAAQAIRQSDSRLVVGSVVDCGSDPQFSRARTWLAAVHAAGAPLDFLSLSGAASPLESAVTAAQSALADAGYRGASVNVIRWPSAASGPDFSHDEFPLADFVLRANLTPPAGLAALSYWRLCDLPMDPGPVSGVLRGGPGLITFQGIVKPAYHAYRYLNALGEDILASVPGGIVTRRKQSGRLVALAYNYPDGVPTCPPFAATLADAERLTAAGSPRPFSITLTGLKPEGQILIEWVDPQHANAAEAWRQMGSPEAPGRQALESLRSSARGGVIEYRQSDDAGHFSDSRMLPPWGMLLLREL